jgi:hypothetical protein
MARLAWSAPEGRMFDTGLDRGVLYPKKNPPPGPLVATNLFNNPKVGVNTGWVVNAGTGGTASRLYSASGGWENFPYVQATWTVAPTASVPNAPRVSLDSLLPTGTVVAGRNYSFGARVWSSVPFARLQVVWVNAADAVLSTSTSGSATPVGNVANTATEVKFENVTAPAGAVKCQVWALPDALPVVGSTFKVTAAMMVEGPSLPSSPSYFDGDTEDDGVHSYEWMSAPNSSRSVQRELVTLSVPWVGLTHVEEQGGDGAAAYYIDGRPFLYLPKPKEYSATIRAYTYPDAFAEIMGVAEVADGMYLDSQPGAAFDLSYRTLVGSALQGLDHGYKIHLVYNAVVTPQSLTYDTLGGSINPVEFAWEIQAVPVRVEGFRPTAHIIIDTRHMDPEKIEAIENLLYGYANGLPHMPSPQTIFDILSYGDTIIVTDMGDGTFTVEGSYDNVYMVGPGEFRVDNVDGYHNSDGTFVISSTNV